MKDNAQTEQEKHAGVEASAVDAVVIKRRYKATCVSTGVTIKVEAESLEQACDLFVAAGWRSSLFWGGMVAPGVL